MAARRSARQHHGIMGSHLYGQTRSGYGRACSCLESWRTTIEDGIDLHVRVVRAAKLILTRQVSDRPHGSFGCTARDLAAVASCHPARSDRPPFVEGEQAGIRPRQT
jgi:hypothetical protein